MHVVTRVAAYIAKQLEPRVRRKRFNLLGSLRFDADLRLLVAFFVDRSTRRARASFARLMHMAQLLSSESAADGLALQGGEGFELAPDEMRALLGLRVDLEQAPGAR